MPRTSNNLTRQNNTGGARWQQMLNKVPEVTVFFWIIKVLCTTIGETAADYLNTTLNLGLTGTSLVMGALLMIVLVFQFRAEKYIPVIYWLAVVLLSVVGTLITDNLTDNLGVSLTTTTIVFSLALAMVSGLFIESIALMVFSALSGSGSLMSSPNISGTICQEMPNYRSRSSRIAQLSRPLRA